MAKGVRGRFLNARVEMASQDRIREFGEFVYEFLDRIFGIDEALVTDQSSLWDFPGRRLAILDQIRSEYGVDVADVKDGNLVEVLSRIRGVTN